MRFLLRLLLIPGLVLLSPAARAAHIIGGELSYAALGGNQYRIYLELFRDCGGGGAPFDDPVAIFVYEAVSGDLVSTVTIPLPGFTDISPDLSDPCLISPPLICVERATYTTIVNLPDLPGGYNIVYQRCCRNNTIINLLFPGSTGSTYVAFVPDPGTMVNSSPRFVSLPPVLICRDGTIAFDHSATDPDSDSLVYELCRPFLGASTSCPQPGPAAAAGCPTEPGPPPYSGVSYNPPYSALFPMDGTLEIDPLTGWLSGLPTVEGQYVVGICVREFRAGVEVGVHYRDFQFNVVNCDRSVVAATSENVLNCNDFTVTFDNTSTGAANFFWDFGVGTGSGGSTDKFPTFTFPDTGTYIVTLVAEPGITCSDTTTAMVSIYPGADIDFSIIPACPGVPTVFSDLSVFAFGTVSSWLWSFGDGSRTHLPEPSRSYAEGGSYAVTLIATSTKGCIDSATRVVSIPHAPEINLDVGLACLNEPVLFTDDPTIVASSITGWTWDFGDGGSGTGNPIEHLYPEPGLYPVVLTVHAANGCASDTTVDLLIRGPTLAEIAPGDTICEDQSMQLLAGGGFFYQWSPALGLNDDAVFNPLASPTSTTTYTVEVGDGCSSDTAAVTVWVLPAPAARAWPDTVILRGESVPLQSEGGSAYAWFPADSLSDPAIPNPIATPGQSTWYHVWVTGDNGCGRFDSVFIEVLPRCKGVVLPNAFTPDGDGRNDRFRLTLPGDDQFLDMAVFNRWGQQVFAAQDPSIGWDGTLDGKPQPLGVYLYVARSVCDGELKERSGTVTLLR